MKVYELTNIEQSQIDEGILDNFIEFGSDLVDLITGGDTPNQPSTTTPNQSSTTTPNQSSTTTPEVPPKPKDTKETAESFKKWLRADGPGRTKFDSPDGPKSPAAYGNGVRRLYAQGYPLRAIEVYKLWKSANITPQELAKIKAAAEKQAAAIGLK